jgi:hypothetical protein
MIYAVLGWVNVGAIVVMTLPLWLRLINKRAFKGKNASLARIAKAFRAVHKPLGLFLAVSVIIHGILALGALRLHTGVIAGAMLIVTAALGATFFFRKKKQILIAHRTAALLLALFVLIHLIFPSALWQLFGI